MNIINQASPTMAVLAAAILLVITILVVATKTGGAPRFTWAEGFVSVLGYRFNCTEEEDGFIVDVADGSDSEEFQNLVKAPSSQAAEREVRRWLATRVAESARPGRHEASSEPQTAIQ